MVCHFVLSPVPPGVSGSHHSQLVKTEDCGWQSAPPGREEEPELARTRFPGCAPREGGLCWVPSPGGPAQETCRESQEPGLPGPGPLSAFPPPRPSTAGSRLAGTPCPVGGRGRERARTAGFPGSRPRGAVTAASAPPPPRPQSRRSVPADSDSRTPPPARAPHAAGAGLGRERSLRPEVRR